MPEAGSRSTGRALFGILLMLFFASGACGLIYQQLWLRELSLVFGVTVQAASTVLAAFFGGLALGSALAGRFVRRIRRPLGAYGVVELAVGLTAVVTPAMLDVVETIYVGLAGGNTGSGALLTLARFVLSFAVLVVPATLMGATLPLVVESTTLKSGASGSRVSLLYATNTAGAIAGTVLAGFWLIGSLGLTTSFRLAATVNVIIGVIAIIASTRLETPSESPADPDATAVRTGRRVPSTPLQRVVLGTFAVSGFVAIALEVVWFRVLVIYLESDTYAFTVMLATVLVGLAVGGYAAAPVLRRVRDAPSVLLAAEVVVAIAAVSSFAFLAGTYGVAGRAADAFDTGISGLRLAVIASGLAILPTSLAMGFAFPVGLKVWVGERDPGEAVGTFYAVNVAGGIAGSLTAGFVLLPWLGARASLVLLSSLIIISAAVLAAMVTSGRPAPARAWLVTGVVAVFLLAALVAVPDPYAAAMRNRFPGETVLWRAEGAQTTVSIHENVNGDRIMYLDGLHQANDSDAMVSFHRRIGILPIALHGSERKALVVGLGGGATAGALSLNPDLEVEVVELSGEVVSGARFLADANFDVNNRPNVDMRVDDARNHLLLTDERYDIITADLILPQHAGAGKLWSVEYWELTRDALAPGGMMVQWVPQDRRHDWEMIVRSYISVFPYVTAWSNGQILVGSNEPMQLDPAAIEQAGLDPDVGPALQAAGLSGVDGVLGDYLADRDALQALVGNGPLLTDDRPRLEYFRSGDGLASDPPDLSSLHGDPRTLLVA